MYLLRWDGGSAPTNPGPTAGSFVIYNQDDILAEGGIFLPLATNNQGEYLGLLEGIKLALRLGITHLTAEGDSMLAVKQVLGEWKVNNQALKVIYDQIILLIKQFDSFDIRWIKRASNTHADSLSDYTIQQKETWEKVYVR